MPFTQELADSILAGLAEGKSLRAVCREPNMPSPSTVLEWAEKHPEFGEQYTRTRARSYLLLAEEIIDISDEETTTVRHGDDEVTVAFDATAVARNRLRVDTRKWMLSKMLPKVYGDKLDLNHSGRVAIAKDLTEDELQRIASGGGA